MLEKISTQSREIANIHVTASCHVGEIKQYILAIFCPQYVILKPFHRFICEMVASK